MKQIEPLVIKINQFFQQYQALSNDALRSKPLSSGKELKIICQQSMHKLKVKRTTQSSWRNLIYRRVTAFTEKWMI